jgi:hypothetical protein
MEKYFSSAPLCTEQINMKKALMQSYRAIIFRAAVISFCSTVNVIAILLSMGRIQGNDVLEYIVPAIVASFIAPVLIVTINSISSAFSLKCASCISGILAFGLVFAGNGYASDMPSLLFTLSGSVIGSVFFGLFQYIDRRQSLLEPATEEDVYWLNTVASTIAGCSEYLQRVKASGRPYVTEMEIEQAKRIVARQSIDGSRRLQNHGGAI